MRGETYARLVRLISCRQSPDRQHGNVVLLPEGAGRSMNRMSDARAASWASTPARSGWRSAHAGRGEKRIRRAVRSRLVSSLNLSASRN